MNPLKRRVNGISSNNERIVRIKLKGGHMAEGAAILVLHDSWVLRDGTYITTVDVLKLLKGSGVSYEEVELK